MVRKYRYIIKSIILFVGLSFPICPTAAQQSCAAQSREDSIRTFLSMVGEPKESIEQIITTQPPYSYEDIIDFYIGRGGLSATYDPKNNSWDWGTPPLLASDSAFVRITIDFIIDRIIHDSLLDWMDKYLWKYYFGAFSPNMQCNLNTLLSGTKMILERFRTPYAADLLSWYYYNDLLRTGSKIAQAEFLFYCMALYVYSGGKDCRSLDCSLIPVDLDMWIYDAVWLEKCYRRKKQNMSSDQQQPDYFAQYKNSIPWNYTNKNISISLSDAMLVDLEKLLDIGIQNSDLECTLTKAFALITGSIFPQDIEQGKELLFTVWPEMQTSEIWLYISPDTYAPTITEPN